MAQACQALCVFARSVARRSAQPRPDAATRHPPAGRLILSQSPEGWWEPNRTTAFVLQARSKAETDSLRRGLWSRLVACLSTGLELDADEVHTEQDAAHKQQQGGAGGKRAPIGKAAAELPYRSKVDVLVSAAEFRSKVDILCGGDPAWQGKDGTRSDVLLTAAQAAEQAGADVHAHEAPLPEVSDDLDDSQLLGDCPLTCSVHAIRASLPPRLARLHEVDADIQALRVWTTLCCIVSLEKLNVCWVWGDGDTYEDPERTIVDAGREWVEAHAAAHPALFEALVDGSVSRRARATVALWSDTNLQRIQDLRRSAAIRAKMTRSHAHRAGVKVTRSLMLEHDTFRTFLSEPLDGLQRWQMFYIIITLVCSQLLVNIWMCALACAQHGRTCCGSDASARLLRRFYAKARAAPRKLPAPLPPPCARCAARADALPPPAPQAVNCCAALVAVLDSGPDGGACASADDCRGFSGNCADLQQQFATVAILPGYPNGLQDWDCVAFPDDDRPLDSFLVGLIAVASARERTHARTQRSAPRQHGWLTPQVRARARAAQSACR